MKIPSTIASRASVKASSHFTIQSDAACSVRKKGFSLETAWRLTRIEFAHEGGEKRNLIDEAQRGKARLRDQGTDSLAAGDLRFHPRIRKPTESGERFELEELGILET